MRAKSFASPCGAVDHSQDSQVDQPSPEALHGLGPGISPVEAPRRQSQELIQYRLDDAAMVS